MKDKSNIDELLNSYIDDELSPRQQTEIKRLITHDQQVAEKLQQLKMCKTLLSALPDEQAPDDLLEDIKSALERRTLLQDTPRNFRKDEGVRYLHFRKVLASAAMIALFAVLATIIYSIVGPDKYDPNSTDWKNLTKPVADSSALKRLLPKKANKPQSIIAHVELQTDAFIATNAFIKRTIEEDGLLNKTSPSDPEESGLYYISSSRQNINLLLADLACIEQRFISVNLEIASADSQTTSSVKNPSFSQINEIINQDSFDESKKAAQRIAAMNYTNYNTQAENLLAWVFEKSPQSLTIPKPVLTSGEKTTNTKPSNSNDKNKVYLTIKLIPTK